MTNKSVKSGWLVARLLTYACLTFQGFERAGKDVPLPAGIYDLEDLKQYGQEQGWCPYFMARYAVSVSLNLPGKKKCLRESLH